MKEHKFFNIHGICLVKDEADVIEQTLRAAAQWCDFIYVFDNGSTDNTWQIVLDLSQESQQIVPYKSDGKDFSDGIRSEVFNYYRSKSSDGDWWCILDADELYIDNPRIFLAKVPDIYEVVWNASFQYYFTDKDLVHYNENPALYENSTSIDQRIRYYINNWSESRFFKYGDGLSWTLDQDRPLGLGAVYPVRIWLKHFQYRAPEQIQRRLDNRYKAGRVFVHELQVDFQSQIHSKPFSRLGFQVSEAPSWHERIVASSTLNYDSNDGRYVVREDLMAELPKIKNQILESQILESQFLSKEIVNRLLKFIGRFLRKVRG